VLEKAARHLTPVTLELGGKSPVFVTKHANLNWAAKRVAWGKWLNAGQTCVAPDYVLVDRAVAPAFIEKLKHYIEAQYGKDVQQSPDYGRIVNSRHLQRLQSYLTGTNVVFGGKSEASERFLEPTLVLDPELDSALMTDEIFGPILPILQVDSVEAALRVTLARPKPLALYIFSTNAAETELLLSRQSSGGAAVNEVVLQMVNPDLPFGGVGSSGFGTYHGQAGLETFSHQRALLRRSWPIEFPLLKPPYADRLKLLRPLIGLLLRAFY
jgi:aldehyde dehydrogenase (NAD+)